MSSFLPAFNVTKEVLMTRKWISALVLAGTVSVAGLTIHAASADDAAPNTPPQAGEIGHGGRPFAQEGRFQGPGAHGPDLRLAEQLSAAETLIGVRSEQLDVWRDYTNALLALLQPPMPPAVSPQAGGEATAPKPFDRETRLIQDAEQRAAKAQTLAKSIDALKVKLTPDQLTRLADADLRFGPPHGGPGEMHGAGRFEGGRPGWHFGGFLPFGHGSGPMGDQSAMNGPDQHPGYPDINQNPDKGAQAAPHGAPLPGSEDQRAVEQP